MTAVGENDPHLGQLIQQSGVLDLTWYISGPHSHYVILLAEWFTENNCP